MSQTKIIPDFMIIGGMKCATSSLHEQLAVLPGFNMSTPKEPFYFSNDEVFNKGEDWYQTIFSATKSGLVGESSTHYAKFPTYPETISRMKDYGVKETKFIYVIREPISRLVSQYIHEWTQGLVKEDINKAIYSMTELADYSRYNYQLEHYLNEFPKEQMLLVFFENLRDNPDQEFQRILKFLDYSKPASWDQNQGAQNVSADRVRKIPLQGLLIDNPVMDFLRQNLIPKSIRTKVRESLQMKKRPELSDDSIAYLTEIFNQDLALLGQKIGCELSVENYKDTAKSVTPDLQ